jgi:antitoxin MazE
MKTKIGKWGNSLAVRIPGAYAKELQLGEGVEVDVTRVNGGLLLRPHKRQYSLEELLERITPDNAHSETDWGLPVGREAW